jgi:Domain of unknown function (DUF4388)
MSAWAGRWSTSRVTRFGSSSRGMAYLSGSLETVPLPRLLQMLAQAGASGWVYATGGPGQGQVYLEAGRVTLALCGSRRGLDALESLVLALPGGQFEFFGEAEVPPPEPNIGLDPAAVQALLDQLARDQDLVRGLAQRGWIEWPRPAPERPRANPRATLLASFGLALLALAFAPELVVGLLLGLLIARELAGVGGPAFAPLARKLTLAVVPFVVLFALIALERVVRLVLAR